MIRNATFSPGRVYRYLLTREWDASKPSMLVIGFNPSIADEQRDDQTIKRCIHFATREGCGKLVMANLYALVSTDPKKLRKHPDPIGPDNDHHLGAAFLGASISVAAWGSINDHLNRAALIRGVIPNLKCLGLTKNQQFPRHPSRLANTQALQIFP